MRHTGARPPILNGDGAESERCGSRGLPAWAARSNRLGKSWLLSICLSALPSPGTAQDAALAFSLASLYGSPEFYSSLVQKAGQPTLAAGQRSLLGAPLRPTAPAKLRAELRYRASDGISATLRQQLAQRLCALEPAQASEVRRALASDWLWQSFDRTLAEYGYSGRNLADVMSAYYVSGWEVVNGAQVPPRFFHAAHSRIAWSLRRSPEIMFMTGIEKQRAAEALGILTSAMRSGAEDLSRQGDRVRLAALQDLVYRSFLQQGVDFRQLTLDRTGFVPRAASP